MNIALIFPGQGSQYIGMGKDFFDNSLASKQIFNNLDETMGLKLTELIFNGSEGELSKTTNSQPAIMSLSVAILKEINAPINPFKGPNKTISSFFRRWHLFFNIPRAHF